MPTITNQQWREYMIETRTAGRVTLAEIAAELGCTRAWINQIERGKSQPPVGFPARYIAAVQRIVARRATAVGLKVSGLPADSEV